VSRLAIVIVSFNAREHLERCLAALATAPPRVAHEIVVVDNGSHDGSPDSVRRSWPRVRLVETGANLGFARATNVGIRTSTSELILLLNSDTLVPGGAIDTLVDDLDRHPEAAAAGPRIVGPDGAAELSFGQMIAPWTELRQKVLVGLQARRVPGVERHVERLTRREQSPDWVSGACLLVRRADAEAVGLLDERFFLYVEDVDFCAALRARSRRILFTPRAEIVHVRGRSVAAAPAAARAAYERSHLAFYEKHHPAWVPALRLYRRVGRLLGAGRS
jgi:GT2 family glycosyltransferase